MKTCTKCKIEKEETAFVRDKTGVNGLRANCKTCTKRSSPDEWKSSKQKWRQSPSGRAYKKQYAISNKDRIQAVRAAHRLANKERINLSQQKYRNSSPLRILCGRLGSSIGNSLRAQGISKARHKWESIVGYTVEELISHLDILLLEKGWSWEDMGKLWELDHKRPVSWFNFTSLDDPQVKECWALSNLQPLLKKDNRSKKNRWSDHPDDIAAGRASLEDYLGALSA